MKVEINCIVLCCAVLCCAVLWLCCAALRCSVLCRVVSCRVASRRVASRRVASRRVASHRIVSYRIVLYCIVNKKWKDNITRLSSGNSRVAELVLRITYRYQLKIVQVYAPTTSHSDEETDNFYNTMDKIQEKETH